MGNYEIISAKLERFIRRYHTRMLIKGLLLFVALGALFFLVILSVEYVLWMTSQGRLLLLVCFIGIEAALLYRYVLVPLLYLLRIRNGITNKEASLLIGRHFAEVDDKLYNLLDLAEDSSRSELLMASIDQRSRELGTIPFHKAINLKEALRYGRFLAIPILIFVALWISGNFGTFFGSYERMVNYDVAYERPAPFAFRLVNEELTVLDTEAFTVEATVEGSIRPEAVFINIQGREIMMQERNGVYRYTFSPPHHSLSFRLVANEVISKNYDVKVLKTPSIQDFRIDLEYPKYLERASETLNSTGNATFPEGTRVTWRIQGENTDDVQLETKDTTVRFVKSANGFTQTLRIFNDLKYALATANEQVGQHERLRYRFKVIKDAHPSISVKREYDSVQPNIAYFRGEVSDDYRVTTVQLICYPEGDMENVQIVELGKPGRNFERFYYTFPSGLDLEAGREYEYYFQATDNDAIHRGKTARSETFSTTLLTDDQLRKAALESQQSIISGMDNSLKSLEEQQQTLQELSREQKERKQLGFREQGQFKDFVEKQQRQERLMERFSKQLKESLARESDSEDSRLLQERLERQEIEARMNERLLEELQKMADKINKDELGKRLEELGKKQQTGERSLRQLLELTKRYYVTEKASQLGRELEKQAEMQKGLSQERQARDSSATDQRKLNQEFDTIATELQELEEDNGRLQKPMDFDIGEERIQSVKEHQEKALEDLEHGDRKETESQKADSNEKSKGDRQANQKSASEKMQKMADNLKSPASSGGSEGTVEDAAMLRQILDNLVIFSFKQEGLYEALDATTEEMPQYSETVRRQQDLRALFEHVDDSLFALSLRRAELSEIVNQQITEVYYNIDKTLESVAEGQIYQGVSHQKYVLGAANELADLLAEILDNMQQSMMSGQGSGQDQNRGFQLPDIIQGQGDLKERMEGMGESGQGSPQEGQEGGEQGNGQKGQSGNQGEEGGGEGSGSESGNEGQEKMGGTQDGRGGGNGNTGLESDLQEVYDIYKEQQRLREQLEGQLQDMIHQEDRTLGEKLVKQMEDFENDLLQNGVTRRTQDKMNTITHELLKMENAAMRQGERKERESRTNELDFNNTIRSIPGEVFKDEPEEEILNRQVLPLRREFQNRVKVYFEEND